MIKFFHIADVHLDTSFYSKKETVRKKLREGIRNSFQNAVNLCINEKVDAFLIAGDLFDNERLSFKTEQFLLKEFNRLKEREILVFYSSGNHDSGHSENRINLIKWPDNVKVFKDDTIKIMDIKNMKKETIAKIVSVGHRSKKEERNLIKNFPQKEGEIPYIGLVHTMITGTAESENHEKYLPAGREDLENKNYDYWALGHIHKRQIVSEESNIYYSGNIQGRNPRETGEKGGLLVTIDEKKGVNVEFKSLAQIQWHNLTINGLEDIKNYRELKTCLFETINDYLYQNNLNPKNTILRLELKGRCYLKKELEIKENRDEIVEELLLDIDLMELEIKCDMLKGALNTNNYKNGDHVLAYLLRALDENGKRKNLVDKLMSTTLSNEKIRDSNEKRRYIEKLIKGLEDEAVKWMVGDIDENN